MTIKLTQFCAFNFNTISHLGWGILSFHILHINRDSKLKWWHCHIQMWQMCSFLVLLWKLEVGKGLPGHFLSEVLPSAFRFCGGWDITCHPVGKHLLPLRLLWTLPTFANLPFHVSNLWLSCLGKRNWFYYKSLTSLVTQNWYHPCDVISSQCFHPASTARATHVLPATGTVLGQFLLCRLIFYDKHRILLCLTSLFWFRWAYNNK